MLSALLWDNMLPMNIWLSMFPVIITNSDSIASVLCKRCRILNPIFRGW